MNLSEQMDMWYDNLELSKCNCECACSIEVLGGGQCAECHYSHR